MIKEETFTEVGLDILLDDAYTACGQEHPRFIGNFCELPMNHVPEIHMDMVGNEWRGKNYDD
jgi:hypothetical protein